MNLPIYYYDLVDRPMLKEIKEITKVNLNTTITFYNLSKLIGKVVKHFKRDDIYDEERLRYIYRIDNFVLDAKNRQKYLLSILQCILNIFVKI